MAVPIGITASCDKAHVPALMRLLEDFMEAHDATVRVAVFGGDMTVAEVNAMKAEFGLLIRYGPKLGGDHESDPYQYDRDRPT